MLHTDPASRARGRLGKAGKPLAIGLLLAVGLYYGGAAYLLRFHLDSVLFPHVARPSDQRDPAATQLRDASGNELALHLYGHDRVGCVIFFPGQHGELPGYQMTLFPSLAAAGVAVFAAAYPGQDGAPGSANLDEVAELSHRAVLFVIQKCERRRTVILGRSLGSMVAVYAAQDVSPAGVVLDSAAPSLSCAIATRIQSRWYLRPLALLPVRKLLRHDYSLSNALMQSPNVPVVVFQGKADRQTPIRDLQGDILPPNVRLVPVPRAVHANTYRLALNSYVGTVVDLIRGHSSMPLSRAGAPALGLSH